jgi:hypothetical protein
MCKAIVEKTPSLVDWKLVYRDPLPTWISKKGRICLLGDAAHPFLPTSAQGATQAMEDGVTIAVCLKRAGRANIPIALKAHQEIRYESSVSSFRLNLLTVLLFISYDRVRSVQKTGESTRDLWHNTDWAEVKKNPTSIAFPREDWIHRFDAEKYAEDMFDGIFNSLVHSAENSAKNLLLSSEVRPIVPVP